MQQQRDHSIRSTKSQPFKYSECFYQKHKLIKGWSQPRSNIVDQPSRSESRNYGNAQNIQELKQSLRKKKRQIQADLKELKFQVVELQQQISETNKKIQLENGKLDSIILKRQSLEEKISYFEDCQCQQKQNLIRLSNMKKTSEIEIQIAEVTNKIAKLRKQIHQLKYQLKRINQQIQDIEDIMGISQRIKRGFFQTINMKISSIDQLRKDLQNYSKELYSMR